MTYLFTVRSFLHCGDHFTRLYAERAAAPKTYNRNTVNEVNYNERKT